MNFLRRAIIVILIFIPFAVFGQEEPDTEQTREETATEETQEEAAMELDMDELRYRITGEARQELMNIPLGSSDVSLFATGSWMGDLQGNFGFSRSPLGLGFASPDTPLLYKQEVDLTLSLWINNRWFVEVNFTDDSTQNTYRAGYQGRQGEFLQYAGVGNTGLDFPSFPYLDLGGDSPSSFGFYGRFETSDIGIHTLVRYDAASREERTFTGGRERTYSDLQPQNTIRGISFVLPDTDLNPEITIYIEDDKGTVRDSTGRRWRYAMQSEYAFSRTQGILELSIRPSGMVAVAYSKGGDNNPWNTSMGSYSGTPKGFLTDVQDWFGSSVDLSKYPQCGNGGVAPGKVDFTMGPALVVYQPGTFSPFEKRNRYDAPSSSAEKAALVHSSSGSEIKGYELILLENTAVIDETFFSGIVSQKGVYELVSTNGNKNLRDPQNCWPLAEKYPEIYLPSSGVFSGDIVIRFTNLSGTSGYFIGTDVIPGSVQVWRSGIQYTDFNYNQSSGEVAIKGSVGQNEIIRITYLKKSEGTRLGSVAAGLGAIYQKKASPFSVQAAVGVRWNITEDSFTEEENSSQGTVGISAKTAWEYDYLKAKITTGFAFVQTDTTGLYRAAGMEGNETIISLTPETSFISNTPIGFNPYNRVDLIYRNYNNNTVLGNNLMYIDWDANVISGLNKPYPVKDRQLGDTQVLAAEFYLGEDEWTGFQVPIYNDAGILSRAREIEIPFRFYDFNQTSPEKFKVIIQIGSLSGKDFAYAEKTDLIWEKLLFTYDGTTIPVEPPYSGKNIDYNARIARFFLTDEDRLKLGDAKYLRIIVVNNDDKEISGRFLLAPPIVRGAAFRPVTYNALSNTINGTPDNVSVIETFDSGVNSLSSTYSDTINKLHPDDAMQRVLKLKWENMKDVGVSAGIDGRVAELPLADYRELSFFVKTEEQLEKNEILKFIVAPGPDSLSDYKLKAEIPLSAFSKQKWSKVTIRYQGDDKGITIDGRRVAAHSPSYEPKKKLQDNQGGRTSYIAILVNPDSGDVLENGTIYIDEIILEDSVMYYRMNAGSAVEYTKPGTLIFVGTIPVLEDFNVYTNVESEGRAQNETEEQDFSGSLTNRTGAGISVFGVKVAGNYAFTTAEDTYLWSADHSLSKTIGHFSVKETFYDSPWDNNAHHNFNMAFSSDFSAKFEADALYDYSRLWQKWNAGLGYTPQNEFIPSAAITAQALWTRNDVTTEMGNYGSFWLETWETLVPDTGKDANARKTQAQIVLTERTKPVGAVISLEGNTNSTGVNGVTQSGHSVFLDIPLTFTKTGINFRMGRGFKRHLYYFGEDVKDDSNKFFESIEDFSPVWGVFPGYSLFAPELEDVMYKGLDDSPSAQSAFYSSFSDHFSTRINLPMIYNTSAFILPNKITLQVERTLEQKMDTRTDKLNLGGGLGFYAINMFGKMGYKPIFKFYQTDEYSHSIDASVYIPKYEDISYRIQSVLSAGFKGSGGGLLSFVNTYTIKSEGYWLESFVSGWEVPLKKSILGDFYKKFISSTEKQNSWLKLNSFFNKKHEQLRKESIELVFDRQTDYMRWNVIAGHEEIVRIQGRLNFSAYIKLRGGEDKELETLIFDVILGTALRVSF